MSLYAKRLLSQTLFVFLAAALPLVVLSDLGTLKVAAFAGGSAVLKFVYGLVVRNIGDPESPNSL